MTDDFSELERELFAYADGSGEKGGRKNGILFLAIEKEAFHLVNDMALSVHRVWDFFHQSGRFPGTEAAFRWHLSKARKRAEQTAEILGRRKKEEEKIASESSPKSADHPGSGASSITEQATNQTRGGSRIRAGFIPSQKHNDFSTRE